MAKKNKLEQPKVLIFDIETSPLTAFVWGLWDQRIGLNMIKEDWYVMSFAAKWLHDKPKDTMYFDQRGMKPQNDDVILLKAIWALLDEADIVITQNGKRFDQKKLNARFVQNDMPPPSSFRHIDTLQIAKKHFAFTSNKLEYMTDKLCVKYKKLKHGKFAGFSLWKECMNDNMKAWDEMEKYNKYDVLSLEELYYKLIPYENGINFNVYHDELDHVCNCGSRSISENGFFYTNTGKFQKYRCDSCGHETRDRQNLLDKDKRKLMKTHSTKR